VKQGAHARFAATERSYQYRITRRKDPFAEKRALFFFQDLDLQTMNDAAALLVGEHDFECFSKVKTDVNNFVCKVKRTGWKEHGHYLYFDITANRFLRGMVRAVVGTLIEVGTHKTSLKKLKSIIASKDRKKAGANVAPHGLYLTRVKYPATIFID
jgi:tRNA pseudouridine38-40 synthase